jgi:XTP/dITP diphosphohydrolase
VRVPRSLLVATLNEDKLRELWQLLDDLPFELNGLASFPEVEPVAETGQSFIENASLKAVGYSAETHLLTLADDSGLEVDELDGAPGIFSARYAGEGATDSQRTARLLAELRDVPATRRTARFVSAIAIANADGRVLNSSVGICEGHIASVPRGVKGFGYDPVFIPNGFDLTFGELDAAIKNRISHRARALSLAREFLLTLTIH